MKKITLTLFIALLALPVMAEEWEYKVVYPPANVTGPQEGVDFKPLPNGAALDITKSAFLNELAKDGWEVVGVVGETSVHSVYLRRRKVR